ncbi:restriction endonuclease subunit S [Vibrio vulnificus]|uniref:restriction endonuclease subunit S n=1 Tax=Vibrio vulnificus TaxID=672 RepID=UPI001A28C914|nr:hypothetical protein [Vibrio vulnificus]
MSELPKGWVGSTIGEACLIENGLRKPISLKERANCQGEFPYYGATGVIDYLNSYTHEGEYVLIGEDGANLLSKSKPLAFIANGKYWVNNHAHTLRCLAGSPNLYLEKYFNSLSLESWVTGSAQPKLTKKNLESIPFPLAPLAEQTRIVEKLDEVLAQVDTIKVRLDGIPAILKRFRQSVLAAAVSGKLTEEWRGNSELSWENVTLSEIISPERPISYGVLKPGDYVKDGIILLRIKDILGDIVSLDSPHRISNELSEQYKRTLLKGDEILISLVGTLGRIALVPKSLAGANVHRNLGVVVPKQGVVSKFIFYLMKSPSIQEQIEKSRTGANQPLLNLGDIKKFAVQLPEPSEQKEIVRLVDQYFAFADTIEAQVKKAQARVDNLTQSILAKAFRGELVPQDPNDEPADKLLERIAQARKEAEALTKAAKKAQSTKSTTKKKVAKSA